MRTGINFLILVSATLLPTLSYAGADMSSAEHGHYCNVVTKAVVIGDAKTDPIERQITQLVNNTSDPVLQSYYRDLYRDPVSFPTVQFVTATDPYVVAITLALYGSADPDVRLLC